MRRRELWQYALFALLLATFALTLLYPIALTVRGGFYDDATARTGFTLDHVALVFRDPVLREGLVNALVKAVAVTLLAGVIALPLALLSAHHRWPGKALWNALVLVPLILPPFVGAIGLKLILGRAGALNELLGTDFDFLGTSRFLGVVIAEALHLYPIVYLNAAAALANLDPAMEEAAESAGAGPFTRFWRVVLPLIRPGLFAGGTIVFIWSFTELGTPLMFEWYAVTPVQIFDGITELEASATPYALTVVMLAIAIACYLAGKFAFGRGNLAMQTRAARAAEERPLSTPAALGATALFGFVTTLALIPHLGVVLASITAPGGWYRSVLPERITFDHYSNALTHDIAFPSIVNSLQFASAATVLNVLLGLLIAYLVVRTKIKGRSVLDALAMLPLAVPGLVLAFGFVAVSLHWPFGSGGPLSGFAGVIGAGANPIPFLIVAYAVRRLPYVVRAAAAGLEQTSGELEEAAVNLGASTLTAVRRVIVPLIAANLIAGGLLAFSFAMLEVSDSLILAQQAQHFPITKAIYEVSQRLGDGFGIAAAMGVWAMALLTVALVGASVLIGKKLGAVFRV
ncbi:MAG: iron ABC transporter permease [Planctomycetota bacterium]